MEQRIHDLIVYQDPLHLASMYCHDEDFDIYEAYRMYANTIIKSMQRGDKSFKACMDAFNDETDDYEILETAEHVERYWNILETSEHVERYWTCKMDSQVASHPNSTQQE